MKITHFYTPVKPKLRLESFELPDFVLIGQIRRQKSTSIYAGWHHTRSRRGRHILPACYSLSLDKSPSKTNFSLKVGICSKLAFVTHLKRGKGAQWDFKFTFSLLRPKEKEVWDVQKCLAERKCVFEISEKATQKIEEENFWQTFFEKCIFRRFTVAETVLVSDRWAGQKVDLSKTFFVVSRTEWSNRNTRVFTEMSAKKKRRKPSIGNNWGHIFDLGNYAAWLNKERTRETVEEWKIG